MSQFNTGWQVLGYYFAGYSEGIVGSPNPNPLDVELIPSALPAHGNVTLYPRNL